MDQALPRVPLQTGPLLGMEDLHQADIKRGNVSAPGDPRLAVGAAPVVAGAEEVIEGGGAVQASADDEDVEGHRGLPHGMTRGG